MRALVTEDSLAIPAGVQISVENRIVKVTGKRGSLTKSFKHMSADIELVGREKKKVVVKIYFGSRKQVAAIRTVLSHIKNMITGVTKGYEYKMRLVYAHFPINVSTTNDGKELEIRNFLGEKIVRKVTMLEGVKIERSEKVKDELVLTGNDVELVSQSAAQVHQSTTVPEKDIRKFLDGIYVSEKRAIGDE
uniref:Predicted protein n=1 Tax=Hordeum vulgare subsp. vulgare TaxID=112509 RepID=F2DP27_HORVV|nr:predicted protein [Hordeum vulgare subsp. vulgare]